MIVTVTMNPAIDKTVSCSQLTQGGLNRVSASVTDAGGKGINVSKTIKAIGGKSIATGFIGGSAGNQVRTLLAELGIETDFVTIAGETRTNLKVVEENGCVTEINEPGPTVTEEEKDELEEKLLQYAGADTLFVFAGSIPCGLKREIYRDMIEKVKEKGASVFLDADGDAFACALEAGPEVIKPNKKEIQEYFHLQQDVGEDELIRQGEQFLKKGVQIAAISLGESGALFLQDKNCFRCSALKVETHSTVGAGDAMAAALSYALDCKMPLEECIRLAMAVSAGAVTTIGTKPPEKELVDKLKLQVEIQRRK